MEDTEIMERICRRIPSLEGLLEEVKKWNDVPPVAADSSEADWIIANLREKLELTAEGQIKDIESRDKLQTDYANACEVIQGLHTKNDSLEAKNADACNTISDLLAQMECLQVANRNLCAGNDTLQERVKNLKGANENLILNANNLYDKVKNSYSEKEKVRHALFETQAAILRLQRKVEKLKKKNKLLAKATLC